MPSSSRLLTTHRVASLCDDASVLAGATALLLVSIRCRGLRIADRVLVVRLGALGDVVRTLPAVSTLRTLSGPARMSRGWSSPIGRRAGGPAVDRRGHRRVSARRNQHGAASGTPAAGGAARRALCCNAARSRFDLVLTSIRSRRAGCCPGRAEPSAALRLRSALWSRGRASPRRIVRRSRPRGRVA